MVEGGWDGDTGDSMREAKEMNIEQYKTQVAWRQCPAPVISSGDRSPVIILISKK